MILFVFIALPQFPSSPQRRTDGVFADDLPTLTRSGANWLFEYNRGDLSQPATTQTVEYTTDLITWTTVAIPTTSAGSVTITPGSPSNRVNVTIPSSGAKTFFRLKVTQ